MVERKGYFYAVRFSNSGYYFLWAKWYPGFGWITMIGGIGYTLASTFMWFTSIYQMWVLPYNGKDYCVNTWED